MDTKEIASALSSYFKGKNITQDMIAKQLEVSQQYVSGLLTGRYKFGKRQAKRFNELFGISQAFLLTGEGELAANDNEAPKDKPSISYDENRGRPYYDVDFIAGFDLIFNDTTTVPSYNIDFAPYNRDGVVWCNITGHSMEPQISAGDIIAIKEVRDWKDYIAYGEVYAIVTANDLRTVKIIRKGSKDGMLRLVPLNTKEYDEQELPEDKITRVFEVLGCMKRL